jgi:hypothetical protein
MGDLELSVMDSDARDGQERSEVGVLSLRKAHVVGAGAHSGGEVSNATDIVRWQQKAREAERVQPLEAWPAALQCTIKEIEPINIDISSQTAHRVPLKDCRRLPVSVTVQNVQPLRFGLTVWSSELITAIAAPLGE